MPAVRLSQSVLEAYQESLSDPKRTAAQHFSGLEELYKQFSVNAEELAKLEFGAALLGLEQEHEKQKSILYQAHQELKDEYKLVEDRILAVEQQLYLGLPDNLTVMDKLIKEQEDIISDQESINKKEHQILAEMSKIDVAHGKQLSRLDQENEHRNVPLRTRFEALHLQLKSKEISAKRTAAIIMLLPTLLLPAALDYIGTLFGLPIPWAKSANHPILSHYVFFISFILIQFFLADRIGNDMANKFAKSNAQSLLNDLGASLAENEAKIKAIEKRLNMKLTEILNLLNNIY